MIEIYPIFLNIIHRYCLFLGTLLILFTISQTMGIFSNNNSTKSITTKDFYFGAPEAEGENIRGQSLTIISEVLSGYSWRITERQIYNLLAEKELGNQQLLNL